ncbi:splicing factor, CC1-like protein [Meredithblackwellia eburnea MCA 4105]
MAEEFSPKGSYDLPQGWALPDQRSPNPDSTRSPTSESTSGRKRKSHRDRDDRKSRRRDSYDDDRDRDRERERHSRSSRRHRHAEETEEEDKVRDKDEKEGGKEKGSERDERSSKRRKHHSRSPTRSRSRSRTPRTKSRSRSRSRSRTPISRSGSKDRSRSRSRSRDRRDRRERSRSRDRDYDRRRDRDYPRGGGGGGARRGYDRDYNDRDRRPRPPRRSPSYDHYDRRRASPPPRRRSESPQLSEEQREMRSIFVSQLSARVTDRELGIFFDSQAGRVREARVIVDRISRRSKGVGYVEFVDLESVQKALALSNTKLLGIPIVVQYTEAEKNRQARDGTAPAPIQANQGNGLYVGSLNFALTESDIRQVFQPFGEVDVVDLHKDPVTGKSKGYAFVQFKNAKDAAQALEKMNNFELAGREIKVGLVQDRSVTMNNGAGAGGGGGGAGGRYQDPISLDEGAGTTLTNISRIELMQKLAARTESNIDLPKAPMFRPNIPLPTTRNVMLTNAFNPEEETERDWDIDLRDDVKGETEEKYGKVLDIFVVKESKGEIYIRFETVDNAISAVAGLNGRWFGGRQITAAHTTDSLFDAKK